MLVVVGGHSRNIGKTSVTCGIIRGLPDLNWTALKITQDPKHTAQQQGTAISEESGLAPQSDSGRFLAAGARHSYWLRTPAGRLAEAVPPLRTLLATAPNVIVESNSILEFLQPDLFIMVLDGAIADFKPSSRHFLARADLLVVTSSAPLHWPDVPPSLLDSKPRYHAPAPAWQCAGLNRLIRAMSAPVTASR
jgi:hypothetical protein